MSMISVNGQQFSYTGSSANYDEKLFHSTGILTLGVFNCRREHLQLNAVYKMFLKKSDVYIMEVLMTENSPWFV